MPQRIGVFREDNAKKIAQAARTVLGMPGTFAKIPERIPRVPPGGNKCPDNFRVIVVGNPTTGTFDLTLVLPGGSDTLTINWDDTAAEVATTIEGHSQWAAAYTVSAADGPFPSNSISLQFGGTGSLEQPTVSNITLSGGARSGVRVERACCEEAV